MVTRGGSIRHKKLKLFSFFLFSQLILRGVHARNFEKKSETSQNITAVEAWKMGEF
jgi:hypothetical protein